MKSCHSKNSEGHFEDKVVSLLVQLRFILVKYLLDCTEMVQKPNIEVDAIFDKVIEREYRIRLMFCFQTWILDLLFI